MRTLVGEFQQVSTYVLGPHEAGGKLYDPYQIALLQGFSNAPTSTGVQPIWSRFQDTKTLDTHKTNLKRYMKTWARQKFIQIDTGLYFSTQTIREITSLRFNPGGTVATYASAEQGISPLICRKRTGDDKDALRVQEQAEEWSSANRTFAEAERLITKASDPRLPPDDYNELLKCIATFCALLHTLFGPRCDFYIKCLRLHSELDDENTADRSQYFSPLLCRQIIWAIIEDSRKYFASQLSPDDFINIVDATDIPFPRSTLGEIESNVRHQTPILRPSFPVQWLHGSSRQGYSNSVQAISVAHRGSIAQTLLPPTSFPPGSVLAHTVGSPSVISVVTTGSAVSSPAREQIRTSDVHPHIKSVMGPYLQKFRRVQLTALMRQGNLTFDGLPTLPAYTADGRNMLCYNYLLGKCNTRFCVNPNGHARAADVTDEFAQQLMEKLNPAIQEFMATGGPRRDKRRRE